MAFEVVSVESLPLLQTECKTFIHKDTQLKVVLCPLPGPLSSCSIVVVTECINDQGLPHTLEHLVFCGSHTIPLRGYLDTLATRCLTDGTNAWTSEDHTAYTVTTAGSEGMQSLCFCFVYLFSFCFCFCLYIYIQNKQNKQNK